ncbi:hypothetical protein D3C78_1089830 [compost metagenome]
MHRFSNVTRQRVAMTSPVISAGLVTKCRFIFDELLLKEHAGFKRIQTQHALTKTVNGKDGSFVHLPLGQQQPLCRLLLVVDLFKQAKIERVVSSLAQTGDTQFMNI